MRTRPAHHAIRAGRRIRPALIAAAACSILLAACGSGASTITKAIVARFVAGH